MARLVTATITFTNGTAVVLNTALGVEVCGKLYIEPDAANTHVCYVGDASLALGTSTVNHVVKLLAKPTAADAVLDHFDLDLASDNHDDLKLAQYKMDGTTNEKARVSAWVE